jgi:hypothetical protein
MDNQNISEIKNMLKGRQLRTIIIVAVLLVVLFGFRPGFR